MKKFELKDLELDSRTLRVLTKTEAERVEGAALTIKGCGCTHTSSRPDNSCLTLC